MKKLLIWLLNKVATEEVVTWLVSKLGNFTYETAKKIIDATLDKVARVERQLGAVPGEEKAVVVRKWLEENFDLKGSKWLINFILELAVALAKKKGLIK